MRTKPVTAYPYEATINVKEKHLKRGKHFAILPMNDALTSLIGRVTAYWSYDETMLHQLIEQMLQAAERTEPNWQRRSFAKRVDLTRELLDQVTFPSADEEGKKRIRDNISCAKDLQWQRNTIVHGSYTSHMPAKSTAIMFTAHGTHNGREVIVPLDPETLEKLWHDIGHLCGDFMQIGRLLGSVSGAAHSFSDTQLLEQLAAMGQKSSPTQ